MVYCASRRRLTSCLVLLVVFWVGWLVQMFVVIGPIVELHMLTLFFFRFVDDSESISAGEWAWHCQGLETINQASWYKPQVAHLKPRADSGPCTLSLSRLQWHINQRPTTRRSSHCYYVHAIE